MSFWYEHVCSEHSSECIKYKACFVCFQGQQARLATLYLPLFSLLLENVHRLNITEASPVTNQTNVVSLTPSVCFRLCSIIEPHITTHAGLLQVLMDSSLKIKICHSKPAEWA